MLAFTIPGLEPLSKAFAYALWAFNSVTGNFGLAIILLTLAMRAVLLPLSIKQTKSMMEMQRLQPLIKELQKKYKNDREKLGQEMMKLYKEHNVSPFGGCLPLILQLPVIFAVFEVLRDPQKFAHIIGNVSYKFIGVDVRCTGSVAWRGGEYAGKLKSPGGLYWQVILLVVLTIITGYVSSKQMVTDPQQSKMMLMMPVIMGVFAWILPIGVTVYIIATNVFTIVQQFVQLEREGFYEEILERRRKQPVPKQTFQRMIYEFQLKFDKILVSLRIRRPPKKEIAAKGKKSVRDEIDSGKKKSVQEEKKGQKAKAQRIEKKDRADSGKTDAMKRSGKEAERKKSNPDKKKGNAKK